MLDWIISYEHDILRWIHVIVMAYWLGGEWGVFNASSNVANAALSLEERKRYMELAYNIDIVPRSMIIWLLPVGFHMAADLGISPITGIWIPVIWVAVALWWVLLFSAYRARGTDRGLTLTLWDERIRYIVIPALVLLGGVSLVTGGPVTAGWFAAKLTLFGLLLIIGLYLRYVMRDWVIAFRQMEASGSTPALEDKISSVLAKARKLAYVYWIGIATVAFFGVVKPF
ncbi:MAG: hypothetical protein D6782_03630 [Alphaproteobacteria bacterium]|nr:MAG: hypothetical protein D6782_03630 [Alphaproteobacteria bacterium]